MTKEFERVSVGGGKEGKSGQRARVRGASGGWDAKLRAINELIEDMVQPTTEVARAIGAVAKGDISQSMAVEVDGRPLRGEVLRIREVLDRKDEPLEWTSVVLEKRVSGRLDLGGRDIMK